MPGERALSDRQPNAIAMAAAAAEELSRLVDRIVQLASLLDPSDLEAAADQILSARSLSGMPSFSKLSLDESETAVLQNDLPWTGTPSAASKPAAPKPAASKPAAPKPAAPEAHSAAADTLEAWLRRQPEQKVLLVGMGQFYHQYAAAGQTVKHRGIRPFAADHGQRFLVTGQGPAMAIRAASSNRAGDEERRHDQDGQLYTKVEFIGEYGGVLEWEQAAKPSSKHALATQAKSAKGAPAPKAAPAAATSSKDEKVLAAGVRILHGAEKPVLLSKFFQELYLELGAEAKEAVQKRGGASKWLKSASAHLLLHKGAGVGDEAVSLQPHTSVPAWAAYLE